LKRFFVYFSLNFLCLFLVATGGEAVDHGATLASLGVGDGAVLTCSEPPPEPTVIDVRMSEVDEVCFACLILDSFAFLSAEFGA
jgi:hypothetical protein